MEKHNTSNIDTTSESNSEAEVFVLSPELLAKLGINLSNIQHPRVQSSATSPVKDSNQNINHSSSPNSLPECRDASSIIETANLMKESVFLSPTFLQTASNATLEEEEPIMMVDKESVNMGDTISTNAENDVMFEEITSELRHDRVLINSNHGNSVNQVDDLGVLESIKEYQVENKDGNLILTDIPYQSIGDALISNESSKTTTQVDEHPDEAYLSDYSNSYSRYSPESFASVVDKQNSLNKKKETQQEVARDSAQLEDTQEIYTECSSSNAIFVSAIMSSAGIGQEVHTNSNIIEPGKMPEAISVEKCTTEHPVLNSNNTKTEGHIHEITSEISSKNLISWTLADQKENELKITKIDYDGHNKSIIYISDPINTENQSKNTNTFSVNSECAQNSEKIYLDKSSEGNEELLSIVEKNINYTQSRNVKIMKKPQRKKEDEREETNIVSVNKTDSLDKVKEIAAYLSQIANERKNIIKNKNCYKEKATKVDPIKSKLGFLGVEKPGGKLIEKEKIKSTKVLRTYQRSIIRKQIPDLIKKSCKMKATDLFQLPINHDAEMDDSKVALKSQNEFCICNDFGNLAYYDCEMLYEHIHFWPHTNTDCDLEILYSIYNDEYTVSNQTMDTVQDGYQNEHNEDENFRDNLCWNELNVKRKNYKKVGSAINDTKLSGEAGSSNEQKTLKKTVRRMTSEIVESKADNDVDNIAKKSLKRSSIAMCDHGEQEAKKKIKCDICNQLISNKVWELHKETDHSSIAGRADKEMEINCPSTSENSPLIKSTRRSSSNFINSKKDIPSIPAQEYSSEISDTSIPASTRGFKNIDKHTSPKSNRRTSKTEIELQSKFSRFSENPDMKVLSQTLNNKFGVLSPSKINKKDMAVRPTKNNPKTDVTPKLTGKSSDVVAIEMDLSTSTNVNSDIEIPLKYKEKAKNIDVKSIAVIPKKSSLNTASNILPGTSSKTNKVLSPKATIPSNSEPSRSAEVVNADVNSSEFDTNTKTIIDTPVSTRKLSMKNDPPLDISLMKPSKNYKLIKQSSVKEVGKLNNNETTDSEKVDKALNISIRSTRNSSAFIDIEPPYNSTENLNIVDTGHKSPRATIRSSRIKSVFSDATTTKSTKNDDLPNSEEAKKSVAPTSKLTANTESIKVAKNIDKKTSTKHTKISSDVQNEAAINSTKVSNAIYIENGSSIEPKIVPASTEKTIEPLELAISSRLLKQSTNIEICESPKSRKRSTNTVTVHSPIKMLKTKEMADSETDILPNASALKNTGTTKINNEQTNHAKMSSVIEVLDDKILKNQSNNDTISTTKSTKNEVKSAIENEQCETTEGKGPNSNKSNTNISNSIEINVPLKCTEPLSQSTSVAIVNSTNSKESSSYIVLNDSQITDKKYTVVREIESSPDLVHTMVRCGVCAKSVENSLWIEHIFKEHHYIAWRDSEPALNLENEAAVRSYLQVISKENDGLKCSKCGLVRKFAKPFMRHINNCSGYNKDGADISTASVDLNSSQEQDDDNLLSTIKSRKSRVQKKSATITCGVCSKTVEDSEWIEHIRVEHKYLAWSAEESPVDLDDEDEVKSHLKYISKNYGGLFCSKCGSKWNYVKKYLLHESLCDNSSFIKKETNNRKDKKIEVEFSPVVTCGICKLDVEGINWLKHIQIAHQYLAWIDGEKPLDVDNYEEVKAHLTKVIKMTGELICMKCGTSRIYPRAYILHVNACTNSGFEMQIAEPTTTDRDKYECGVCHEKGKRKHWKDHAMKNHYNVAWMVGELPINIRNFYAVEKHLKEYQKKHSLICSHCRTTRTSCYGFYAHILTCGKTDEEIDAVHNLCEICNNKYLCVYRNQHIASHRDSIHRKEMRELKAQHDAEEALKPQEQKDDQPMGKRRAAEKAKKVIKKYSSNVVDGKLVCSCGATFENEEELSQHNCTQKRNTEDDESDVSVKTEPESEVESDGSEIDSTLSDSDEEEQKRKKRHRIGEGSTKITRMSYKVNNYNSYLAQGYKDFSNLHYTSDSLFNDWRGSECETVPPNEMHKYLPSLTESCKVRFDSSDDGEWITYKRFESKKIKGYSIFTGGAVQCISWAPPNKSDETLSNYLAVYTHHGPDVPRHGVDELPEHPALVQIWDFKQFNFLPKCVLTLALDYGIVWAMDWCPSGGRDQCGQGGDSAESRLGLLAVACSNGTAYILTVPCPPASAETEDEPVMYKPKIVAELRMSMTSVRRIYQATCIKWSQQKGHETIIVGYSDGTTALYDVNTESPFLKSSENGVTIFYPYQDKQSESSAITGVGMCVSSTEGYSSSGYFSASLTGGTLGAWPHSGPSVRVHAAAAQATHAPHWPAVMIAGDAPFMKGVTELEWWGGGRRVGASRAVAACARCGRSAHAAAPAVRVVRAHPCYPDIKKLIIATLLMVPVGQKRKRKVNDDLSMVVEPLTYEHAIGKYGLQFNVVPKNDQVAAQQLCSDNELCPERFPLSDMVAVAFCPSSRFHDKLAVATHTGIIFIINA